MSDVTITPGTLIHGTLRPQDLLPAFAREYARVTGTQESELYLECDVPASALKRDSHFWWISEDAAELIDRLVDLLTEQGQYQGYYFGNTEGDGSDFGWWPIETNDNQE